jgi:histidine triad (HIT) family protein
MTVDRDPECLFCKIVGGQLPASIVLQDDLVTAFRDINPQMPVHVLVVPNQHIVDTTALAAEHDPLVGAVVRAAHEVARREGLAERGYRLVLNTGRDALNTVPHLHLHVLGGRSMTWPPG